MTEALGASLGLFIGESMLIWQNKEPEQPYEYQEYPKWIGDKIVSSADEEAALTKPAKQKKQPEATE